MCEPSHQETHSELKKTRKNLERFDDETLHHSFTVREKECRLLQQPPLYRVPLVTIRGVPGLGEAGVTSSLPPIYFVVFCA